MPWGATTMQVTFIVSRVFENTQEFVRAVAQSPGLSVTILKGEDGLSRAVRTMRFTQRVWFEGLGPLLTTLIHAPRVWDLPKACLRVGEDEVASLPLPDLWSVVSDLIVPSRAAARRVQEATDSRPPAEGASVPGRIHVVSGDLHRQILGEVDPEEDLARLADLLLKPPGDLPREVWETIAILGEVCRGRVLVRGEAPEELVRHLTQACGRTVVRDAVAGDGPFDSIVFWKNLSAESPEPELADGLVRVRAGGAVAVVTPRYPKSKARTPAAIQRLLVSVLEPHAPDHIEVRGRVVLREADPAVVPLVGRPSAPVAVGASAPLVTAIVPVYNDAQRLGRALVSLRLQTYPNLEILVVDDGSTDGTAAAAEKHLNDPRVRYLYKAHSGRPESRNRGIRDARGDYIAWLDSDDESLPNRIQAQVNVVLRDPSVDVVHSDGFFISPDGVMNECRRYRPFTAEELPRLLLAGFSTICPILNTSAMVRRDLYDRVGGYDPAYLRCQDYEFWVRTALAGNVRYAHVPVPLVMVYQSPPSPGRLGTILDYYWHLAARIIESFPPERLADPVARDLHEPQCMVMARYLAGIAIVFRAPAEHPIYEEARKYLKQAVEVAEPNEKRDAYRLFGALAQSSGNNDLAGLYFARANDSGAAAVRSAQDTIAGGSAGPAPEAGSNPPATLVVGR